MKSATLQAVAERTAEVVIREQFPRQNLDSGSSGYGGVCSCEEKLYHPFATGYFAARAGVLYAWLKSGGSFPGLRQSELLERMTLALDALVRMQRESGLIDLFSCNYDSAPDTAFIAQSIAMALDLEKRFPADSLLAAAETAMRAAAARFLDAALPGMISGGFHTPNHRWVISSALTLYAALFPGKADEAIRECLELYLAETIDVDEDGIWLERSSGGYDIINDRAMLIMAQYHSDPKQRAECRAAAEKNLRFNARMLHADGTIETGLSRRQDYGTRRVHGGLIGLYLESAALSRESGFRDCADFLFGKLPAGDAADLHWAVRAWLLRDIPEGSGAEPETRYSVFFSANRLWRLRDGKFSASVFGEKHPRLLSLVYGRATLAGFGIHQSYFSPQSGAFLTDAIEYSGDSAVLICRGETDPLRPGYNLPSGKPCRRETYFADEKTREIRRLPNAHSRLYVDSEPQGLRLRYRTLDGLHQVTTQVYFDFPVGGIWESASDSFLPAQGQVVFLKDGMGRMQFGEDAIEIGPGRMLHRTWNMRNAVPIPDGCCRVIIALTTPIDCTFALRGITGQF